MKKVTFFTKKGPSRRKITRQVIMSCTVKSPDSGQICHDCESKRKSSRFGTQFFLPE